MERKERVPKGYIYWFIDEHLSAIDAYDNHTSWEDDMWAVGNYFNSEEDCEEKIKAFRAVLNGADVIEMPSEEEIEERRNFWDRTPTDARTGFGDCLQWLKSKIVK